MRDPSLDSIDRPELAGVAMDLADLEAFERWREGRAPSGDEPDEYRRKLAAAVRGDVLNASMLIAAMASIANAGEGRTPTAAERAALAFLSPTHSVYFSTAVERLMATDLAVGECWRLQTYLARLSLAQRMSAAIAARPGQAASAGDIDPEIHADAWRRACGAAIAVIEALDAMIGDTSEQESQSTHRSAMGLLRSAVLGGKPCLDPEGRVTVPGWAERRREGRLALNVVATATVAGRPLAVIIRDASPSGLGLTLSSEVDPGAAITVTLGDGRRITGRIAWSVGRRAGVRLDHRLEPDDLSARR